MNAPESAKSSEDGRAMLNVVTRLYKLSRQINQAIVRNKDRDRLFRALCRVAVESGGFRMAWVGLADRATDTICPVARAGHEDGYLDVLSLSMDDKPAGRGPTGTAIREGRVVTSNDIRSDPQMLPWRDDALARGYRSSAAIPFRLRDQVIGALSLYAEDPGFFSNDERMFLEDIGVDISFALDAMEGEKERDQAQESYRQLFEAGSDAIFLIDNQSGRILEANTAACSLYGYRREEILAVMNTDLSAEPEDTRGVTTKTPLAPERVVTIPLRWHRKKDGTKFPVEITGRFFIRGDRPVHLAAIRDISRRLDAEEEKANLQAQLVHAQKMESVGRLAGGVAHDFNNMLGVILGHTEMALEQVGPLHPMHADLVEIHKAATRSADLTRQLLAFARRQTITPRVLDLNATVDGMLKMLRRLIGEDIALAWSPGDDLPQVKIDPSQVSQILANLCVNARDAIHGVGNVAIATSRAVFDDVYCASHGDATPGSYVALAISDDGDGMAPEVIEHLFEPFFTTKELGEGTGLGLATVYGIVKQNGGFIDVETVPGQGTTFSIYVPEYTDRPARSTDDGETSTAEGGRETVLLVEDEPAILSVTRRMLERLGYKVLPAPTPVEAIKLAEEYPDDIQVLIADVVMPEMNGRDLAKRLLSLYPNIRRIFMSGYTADVIAHHGVVEDGVHFLQKPFSTNVLATRIREVLERD